ncbi:phosphatase PAP2 family protein [Candidatus Daviesbacteria bacterium]|nr:phosphatase PAP2 family protein [Candidatus Daviesbacteria bacterium]
MVKIFFWGITFAILAIFAHWNEFFPIDPVISQQIQSINLPYFNSLMEITTVIGNLTGTLLIIALISLALLARKKIQESIFFLVATATSELSVSVIKELVARPRPDGGIVYILGDINGLSFPSSHVTNYIVIFGLISIFIHQYTQNNWLRHGILAVFILLIALGGLSRIYLGVHWPSDVLGGYFYGSLLLTIYSYLYKRLVKKF